MALDRATDRPGTQGGWIAALLAGLVVAWGLESRPERVSARAWKRLAVETGRGLGERPRAVELSLRDWRSAPAIGRRRAADLVAARWCAAPGVPWRWWEVPGIGPRTEERVRAWLARAGSRGPPRDRRLARSP